jgi:ABC-type polysaccharide/polyol phosphate transport system ATPase subunit
MEQKKVITTPAFSVSPDPRSQGPDSEIAISVQNLTKTYKLYDTPLARLKESINPFGRKYHNDFHALNDVNFEITKGETVGIIGKNGSGKSTLLKILTGVLAPSSGTVTVNGKISALLELGAGFNPELTGIENIYFNATMMGYTRAEMDARLDDILSFADIGEFVYQPVKSYSSGMFVRLAFAVAINVDPEILIVDEALSVGDVFFQQKCYVEIRKKIDSGITCLFVSHDTAAITNICNRALLVKNGRLIFDGLSLEGVSRYLVTVGEPLVERHSENGELLTSSATDEVNLDEINSCSIIPLKTRRHGAGGAEIIAVRVLDLKGRDTMTVDMLEALDFQVLIKATKDIIEPSFVVHLFDRFENIVFATGTRNLGVTLPDPKEGQKLLVCFRLTFSVQPGEYTFSIALAEPSAQGPDVGFVLERMDMLGPITVIRTKKVQPFWGIAQLPIEITLTAPIGSLE